MTERQSSFGFVEWFRPGEYQRVETAIAGMRLLGATCIRTHLSWAEFYTSGGADWYDWLIPKLGSAFELLPCIHYTPPSLSRTGRSSGPPRRLRDYADFVDHVLTRYGEHFRHVELWNEPNNLLDWDWREDCDWQLFCEMIGAAAYWLEHRGWKAVLGGACPFDAHWLDLMGQRGILATVSAVGLHAFPGTWDSEAAGWLGYPSHITAMREVLDRYNKDAEVWITEAGYSTWRRDEHRQVEQFREALIAPAARLYWYGWQDLPRTVSVQQGLYFDPRHYHLGVTDVAGRPKLLHRHLAHGIEMLRRPAPLTTPRIARPVKPHVILGGAGFVGANLADAFMHDGDEVIVFDNLSRPGVERNVSWLAAKHGALFHLISGDIRDQDAVTDIVGEAGAIFHLAAQVAVTSSLVDPIDDFSVNAQGTLTVLEAIRSIAPRTPLVFASTNKVYGDLADIALRQALDRYIPIKSLYTCGVDEKRPLEFCTPYGCSKGAADQYVLDYAHSFGLRTAVLRKSCIYGPRQFGTEDQGWVAHFMIRALRGEKITIYGNGKQVRDILHVRDAVAAYRGALAGIGTIAGQAFNLGGGADNAVSLRMVLDEIMRLTGLDIILEYGEPRVGDQCYFVSDTARLTEAIGWHATIGWRDGIRDLAAWLRADLGLPLVADERLTA